METYSKKALLNAAALGAFAVGTALVLGITFTATREPIAESQRLAEEKALLAVIGDQPYDNDLINDQIQLSPDMAAQLNTEANARVIRNNGTILGFILPAVAPDGYSGNIGMLVGMDTQGNLLGVRVVEHRETPGLGDKVDTQKSDWILQFTGLSLENPDENQWFVRKDGGQFDAFTGATITPRALVNMIKTTLVNFRDNTDELIKLANESETSIENNVEAEASVN